ncbi:hypothetical protein TNCV_3033841 [Trichonephila clavipes]|nr:hypothetical protein TNCV_3033841 [Trichonephila clavipes]
MRKLWIDGADHFHLVAPLPVVTDVLCAWQWWIAQPHHDHEPYHNRFNLLHILQSPLVPHDVVCSRMECLQGVHCFIYSRLETAGACSNNGAMNDGHGQRNGMTLYLLTNPASACNITMVGFKFEDTMGEVAELLRYPSPHWYYTWYHGSGWYCLSLPHPSSTHCHYTKQPALHL